MRSTLLFVCMCVCMYVCVCVCMYVDMCTAHVGSVKCSSLVMWFEAGII